jgi:predicted transglutaminase-like cysteine proteinase
MTASTKKGTIRCGAAVGIVLLATLVGATASQASNHGAFMPPGDSAPPPSGWLQFCLTYRGICKTSPLPAREVILDEQAWHQLKRVNDWVNHHVMPMTDMAHYGMIQWWRYPDDGAGACHSYALLKQRLLVQAGWPRQALLMTVVRDHDGEGHAVLAVQTNNGDFILDNLTDRIRLWSDTGYQYIERQSQSDPNQWIWATDPSANSAVHAGLPKSEQVRVDPRPFAWPTWGSADVPNATQQANVTELPIALAGEVAERIKAARAAATDGQEEPANPTLAEDLLPDNETSTAFAATNNRTALAVKNGRWAVQLIGSTSQSSALTAYRHLQDTYSAVLGSQVPLIISTDVGMNAHWYRVRVSANDRRAAENLCTNLRAAGGSCLVQRDVD